MRAWVAMVAGIALLIALWLRSQGEEPKRSTERETAQHAAAPRRAAPRAMVSGRVTRASDGTGIAGATVTLRDNATALPGVPPIAIATDGDGTWSAPIPTGNYAVAATAEGFLPHIAEHVAIEAGAHADAALVAGGWLLSGVVTDLGGGPVAHARIEVAAYEHGTIVATTSAEGRYRVTLASGGYDATAKHEDYAGHTASIQILDAPETLDFALVPGATIRGHVVARGTGEPVADALVDMRGQLGDTEAISVLTDEDGSFMLHPIGSGAIELTARGPHHATGAPTTVEVGVGDRVDDVRIVAEPAFAIAGRVVDRAGKPIAGVALDAKQHDEWRAAADAREDSDADGRFEILGLLPGRYTLGGWHDGAHAERANVQVVDRDLRDVVVVLAEGATLAGRVDPPRIATVRLDDSSPQTTGADGAFAFQHVTPGRHSLQALTADRRTGNARVVMGASDRGEVLVPLVAAASLSGRVVDDLGAPVPDAWVQAFVQGKDGNPSGDDIVAADPAGRFELLGLAEGRAVVYAAITRDALGTGRGQQLELRAGAHTGDLVLVAERPSFQIRGEVVDAAGTPVADAWVTAIRSSGFEISSPIATKQDGAFTFEHLTEGTYTLTARSSRGDARGEIAAKTGEPATIRLAALGAIVVRVTLDGAPVTTYDLRCASYLTFERHVVSPDGTHTIDHLDPHRYTCDVVSAAGNATGAVEVADQPVSLELRLAHSATVAGTVVNALTGAPLGGLEVTFSDARGLGDELAITAADGSFAIGHAPASGSVAFRPAARLPTLGFAKFSVPDGQRVELGTIRVAPPKTANTELGLGVEPEASAVTVVRVEPGGPAERAGIVRGDSIVAIDGVPISGFATYAAYQTLANGLAIGQLVRLGLARGETISVTAVESK